MGGNRDDVFAHFILRCTSVRLFVVMRERLMLVARMDCFGDFVLTGVWELTGTVILQTLFIDVRDEMSDLDRNVNAVVLRRLVPCPVHILNLD